MGGGKSFNKIFFRGFNKSRPLWHSLSFGYFHNSDSCSLGNYSDQCRSRLKEFFCVFFAKSFPFKVWIKLTFRRGTILFYFILYIKILNKWSPLFHINSCKGFSFLFSSFAQSVFKKKKGAHLATWMICESVLMAVRKSTSGSLSDVGAV